MAKTKHGIIPAELDYSMFDETDFLNFVLQRSEILFDIPRSGALIKNWTNGTDRPLQDVVRDKSFLGVFD